MQLFVTVLCHNKAISWWEKVMLHIKVECNAMVNVGLTFWSSEFLAYSPSWNDLSELFIFGWPLNTYDSACCLVIFVLVIKTLEVLLFHDVRQFDTFDFEGFTLMLCSLFLCLFVYFFKYILFFILLCFETVMFKSIIITATTKQQTLLACQR